MLYYDRNPMVFFIESRKTENLRDWFQWNVALNWLCTQVYTQTYSSFDFCYTFQDGGGLYNVISIASKKLFIQA